MGSFPLLLAPMEDVSDPPFRALCKENGADVVYTEFISSEGLIRNAAKSIQKLDIYEKELPPLTNFILPGGSITSSYLHLSRAKSREVERCLASISEEWIKDSNLNAFMNRLSDLFFVLARAVNKRNNIDDVPWNGKN